MVKWHYTLAKQPSLILVLLQASDVCAAQQDSSPAVSDPSQCNDTLDSVLRTSLYPHDPEFEELSCRRIAWWDSSHTRSWFLEKGYTLYHIRESGMDPASTKHSETPFPFPMHGELEPEPDLKLPILHGCISYVGNIAFAQNTQGQHVAFKAVLDGSEEFRILKYLHNQGIPRSIDDFHHVIPVLDVLPCEGHWIAVMPRHRIAHGDIKTSNILVNHVNIDRYDSNDPYRRSLRSQGKLTYALYDFDGSTMFPPSMSLDECRLPSHISFNTLYGQAPGDTMQGEFDFNPFAFDVGMLGVMFCHEFQHMVCSVPMLAPLFDRMTTRDIARRFKASEALQFFEQQVIPLTSKRALSFAAEAIYGHKAYDRYDRWKYLDPDFVKKWAAYREPPIPRHILILRKICLYPWIFDTISYIRRVGRFVGRGWAALTRILPWI
ncbi:hypothetical protein H2248_007246 [Termitomyces sp. 'cryptogamus']|nr:hypothetical protein H2248_007246 [Termitomyces sp. 'cryptogamus']